MSVKLIIDSSSDISKSEADSLGITMIPMLITIGDKEYYDGVDITPQEFYEKLEQEKSLPKTAQVTPFRFEDVFEKVTSDGSEAIAIVLSSKLSGTCAGAKLASEKFNGKVFVVDSLNATVGERLLIEYALTLIDKGWTAKKIYEELEQVKSKIVLMGALDTLEYLKKGGRISSATAFIGGMLNIKPIVHLVSGEVKMLAKARGNKKSYEFMNNVLKDKPIDFTMPYGVLWTGTDDSNAKKYIEDSNSLWQGYSCPKHYVVGSTIGTHVGPGVVGIAYFKK